ncbi:hypothetical protein G3O06_32235 [Burkholderia sp. Ac-20345]|uniref:hypothetical protein n=1 Tax=Burkholderia sp. Ac-20345 TaxID=2703891 RepID=UPI00197B78CA|nr:hypothetical protein [Burkholderia sp. Ac-20345]MBN3782168.1 hypothetical protein [Burkholderia sp. Ac-20345]
MAAAIRRIDVRNGKPAKRFQVARTRHTSGYIAPAHFREIPIESRKGGPGNQTDFPGLRRDMRESTGRDLFCETFGRQNGMSV